MKTEFDPPVFVVGSSRSGTTLLYSILQSSGEFALYQAETLLLEVCQAKYGNLKNRKTYERFINDWIKSKQFYRSGLDPNEFIWGAKDHHETYIEFMRYFMECIARKQGKKRWAEQTPGHIMNMKALSQAFPGAKFIHVIRDGRDVALSRRKLGWTGTRSLDSLKNLISAAKSWEIAVKTGQTYGKALGNNYLEIFYEDLINNLDIVLEKISVFMGIEMNRAMIENSTIGSLGKSNTAFHHETAGISAKSLGRWRDQLTDEEIFILHSAIGKTLAQLGYGIDSSVIKPNNKCITWKTGFYLKLCPVILSIRRFLRNRTLLGRWTSSNIEIGLR